MKKITKKIKTLELSSAQVANIARMNTNYYDTIVPAPQYVLEQVAKTVEEERKVVFRHVVYKKETHNEANDLIQTFWVNLSEFAEKYPLLDLYKKLPPDGIVLEKDYDNIKKDVKYRTSLYKDLIKNRKDRLEKMNFIKRWWTLAKECFSYENNYLNVKEAYNNHLWMLSELEYLKKEFVDFTSYKCEWYLDIYFYEHTDLYPTL